MTFTIAPNERTIYCSTFTRYAPKTFKQKPIAVFDCETADATLLGPIGGIALTSDHDYPKVIRFGNHENIGGPIISFLKYVLSKRYRGFVFYAHKSLSFDMSHILANGTAINWLNKHGFTIEVDRSFIKIKRHKHVWMFGDSYRIVQDKLENILKYFAPEYTKAPLPKIPFSWHNQEWIARITNDTLGLYASLKSMQKIIQENFEVPLSLTSSATALRAARLVIPFERIKRPCQRALDWIRAGAYSGGRVEVFHQGKAEGNVRVFDINSAYAWALKGDFPIDAGRFTMIEPTSGMYIARCSVSVPKGTPIPPVLSRLYHHNFPVGSFEAMLTNEEVEFTRQSGAYVKYIEGWAWSNSSPVFRQFIERCERLRAEDYHSPKGKLVKLMQNSLYGILGMSPVRRIQTLSQTDPGKPWTHVFNLESGKYVPNVYERLIWRESPNQMPHWAAIITARVRVRLTQYLYLFEQEGHIPLYCHTDSIWTVSPNGLTPAIREHITPTYGGLKIEHKGNRAIIVSPGEAVLFTEKDGPHVASKGWPGKNHIELFEKEQIARVPQTQVFRAGTALKRGNVGQEINRKVVDYNSMRNRIPARSRPGATVAREADPYNYSYWHFTNWFPAKLYTIFPRKEIALRLDPWEAQFRAKEKKHRIRANRSAGQSRRLDREFAEGYARYLLEQEDRMRYAIEAGNPVEEDDQHGGHTEEEKRPERRVEADRGEESSEGDESNSARWEHRTIQADSSAERRDPYGAS